MAKTASHQLGQGDVLQRLLPAHFSGKGKYCTQRTSRSLRSLRGRVGGFGCVSSACLMHTANSIWSFLEP